MRRIGLPVAVLVLLGGVSGLAVLFGLGNVAVLAGLTALFCLLASFGGPLAGDLRLLAVFAPALVAGVGVPRLVADVWPWAGVALLTAVVFVAALLPALGSRYVTVGLGLGMAALFGYGYQLTGAATAGELVAAPALGAAVAVLLRVLLGLRDPGEPTRKALADALDPGADGTAVQAARTWLADRPVRWTARVLGGILRYQALTAVLTARRRTLAADPARELDDVLRAARAEAGELAAAVRPRTAPAGLPGPTGSTPAGLPGDTGLLVDGLWAALGEVRAAATGRDHARAPVPPGLRGDVRAYAVRGALGRESAQLRHAARCALGVLLALVVASYRPGDPLTVSFLLATFAIMQPEWRDTLGKAWQRVVGSLAGAVVLALALWLLPPPALLPLAVVAMLAGFLVMRSAPVVFNGCVVLMAVGMNAATRSLDPGYLLVEYVLLMLLAVVIGLLFGFAAIPGVRRPSPRERRDEALAAQRALLAEVASVLRGQATSSRRLATAFSAAAGASQQLLTTEAGSAEPAPAGREAAEQLGEGLDGLTAAAAALLALGSAEPDLAAALEAAVAALDAVAGDAGPDLPQLAAIETLRARETDEERTLLLDAIAADLVRVCRSASAL